MSVMAGLREVLIQMEHFWLVLQRKRLFRPRKVIFLTSSSGAVTLTSPEKKDSISSSWLMCHLGFSYNTSGRVPSCNNLTNNLTTI